MNDVSGNNIPTNDKANPRSLALSQKVQSLRLSEKLAPGGGPPGGFIWAMFILILILAGALGYNVYATQSALKKIDELDKKASAAAKKNEEENEPLPEGGDVRDANAIALQYKGSIVPIAQILVSPEVGGKVVWLKFKEGQTVEKNAILAKIEDIKYKAEYDRAVSTMEAAKHRWQALFKFRPAEIRQAKLEVDDVEAQEAQASIDFKRAEGLKSRGSISEEEYQAARAKFLSLQARREKLKHSYDLMVEGPRDEQIAAAKAEVDGAKAQVVAAKKNLDDTVIKAPVTGTILTKKAEENNQVNPSAFSNGLSASLCEMADLTELEIDVSIVQRDRSRVKVNQECRIRVDAWPGKIYEGYVSRIMPLADRSKNAIPVRVRISKKQLEQDLKSGGPFLLPEMSADVSFLNTEVDQAKLENK